MSRAHEGEPLQTRSGRFARAMLALGLLALVHVLAFYVAPYFSGDREPTAASPTFEPERTAAPEPARQPARPVVRRPRPRAPAAREEPRARPAAPPAHAPDAVTAPAPAASVQPPAAPPPQRDSLPAPRPPAVQAERVEAIAPAAPAAPVAPAEPAGARDEPAAPARTDRGREAQAP